MIAPEAKASKSQAFPTDSPFFSRRWVDLTTRPFALPMLYIALLAWLNIYICREAFTHPASGHFNSMHGEWIALARLGNFASWTPQWWPWWGAGVPLEYTYAPLVPAMTAWMAHLEHYDYLLAFNQINGLVYCLLPLVFYTISWRISRLPGYSFIAAAACSLISPITLLLPDQKFHWSAIGDARRLFLLFDWDDLPHVTSLMLVPIVVWSLHKALTDGRSLFYAICALGMSAMMLANMFGAVLVALIVGTVPWALGAHNRMTKFVRSILVAAGAYVLACPWLPPSLLLTIRANSILNGESARTSVSVIALLVTAMAAANVWRLSKRWSQSWGFRWLLVAGSIVLVVPALDYFAGLHFVPQPGRYKIEADVALIWIIVFASKRIVDRFPTAIRVTLALALVILAGVQAVRYRRYSKALLKDVDMNGSIEYRASKKIAERAPAQRTMLTGSIGQWANVFVNVPQAGAQPYTTTPNFNEYLATYILYSGDGAGAQDAAISELWLKAFGAQTVVVPGPISPEYWKPFAHPSKFEGVLPVLWRERDTTAYAVQSDAGSLAHPLMPAALVQHTPVNGLDVGEIRRYVDALETSAARQTAFRWQGTNKASIDAELRPGEMVSVQINFDKGWKARVGGRPVRVFRDGLGLLAISPECTGTCRLELDYEGSNELRSCRIASAGIFFCGLAAALIGRRRANGSER